MDFDQVTVNGVNSNKKMLQAKAERKISWPCFAGMLPWNI